MVARFYIDGFNLYHALDESGRHELKWLNVASLARHLTGFWYRRDVAKRPDAELPAFEITLDWFSAWADHQPVEGRDRQARPLPILRQ